MFIRDTIAAISTPIGDGGIGIIRISGDLSGHIAQDLFNSSKNGGLKSHRFSYGAIINPLDREIVDEVMVVIMKAPNSYTREDVLEIHCHGGYLIVQKILGLVLMHGARLAEPGEFTKRAFLNGRIDLVQAEAVIDLIRSRTDASLALARHQSEGLLSLRLKEIKDEIVKILAYVEAYIDFPDEDIDSVLISQIVHHAEQSLSQMGSLLSGFNQGRVLREGVSVAIAGRPNVGKSSLLNTLLRENRAIVTDIPGTTRDVIEEVISIKGLPVRISDTAGIRDTVDHVEQEGISRAFVNIDSADLVLFVVDCSKPFDPDDAALLDVIHTDKLLVVCNKADLMPKIQLPVDLGNKAVFVSTVSGLGVDTLECMIHDAFIHGESVDSREYVAISKVRHRDALERAAGSIRYFIDGVNDHRGLELLSIDLRDTLRALGEITGETTADDVLDKIFSSFCVGK